MAQENSGSNRSFWMNLLVIVGFIIVIAIGLWGAANAAKQAPRFFKWLTSSITGGGSELGIEIPESANAGEPVAISWGAASGTGTYVFTYACREGFEFQAGKADGTFGAISCETPFAVPGNETTFRTVPIYRTTGTVDVPFTITFIGDAGEKLSEGTAVLRVVNSATPNPNTPATTTPPVVKPPVTNPPVQGGSRTADLTARVLEVGVIDPSTGMFIPRQPVRTNEIAAVRFEVKNIGTGSSGSWNFSASLPTQTTYQYTSPTQGNLNPGDRIEFTLRFDRVAPQGGTFGVVVDPNNRVQEISESNNTVYQPISATN